MMKKRILGIGKDTWSRDEFKRDWFYAVETVGFIYHMSNINAAVSLVQFRQNPDLKFIHTKEIALNKRIVALQLGKSLWPDSRTKDARHVLGEHLSSYRVLLAYVGILFPYRFTTCLWRRSNLTLKRLLERS